MSRDQLVLNQDQTELVRAIEDTFQPSLRPALLANVHDRLIGCADVSDRALMRAIDHVRAMVVYDDFDDCI